MHCDPCHHSSYNDSVALSSKYSAGLSAQDAHFVTDAGAGAFGLSDGVSSWSDVGVDAAEYSRRVTTPPLP